MLLYCVVLAIGLAGLLQASWWAAVIGGCALALMFIASDRRDGSYTGDLRGWATAQTASSLGIALVASPVAFVAGRISASVWGL